MINAFKIQNKHGFMYILKSVSLYNPEILPFLYLWDVNFTEYVNAVFQFLAFTLLFVFRIIY